jgi:hypothetical protein
MKPNTKAVLEYLKSVHGKKDVTAADVAAELGLDVKQVNGIFTAALQRKEYGYREEVEIQLDDGSHSKVKMLHLTDAGLELTGDED